jgi:hypothetical protein
MNSLDFIGRAYLIIGVFAQYLDFLGMNEVILLFLFIKARVESFFAYITEGLF